MLESNISLFLDTNAANRTFEFEDRWNDIMRNALITKAKPAMWFFGSAVGHHNFLLAEYLQTPKGMAVLSLAVLGLLKWWGEMGETSNPVVKRCIDWTPQIRIVGL